jgi:hypothetical protein
MRMRLLVGIGLLVAAVAAGPVAAGDFTGTEKELRTLPCPGEGEGVPANQEPPGPDDCPGEEDDETYEGHVWTNDVRCNDGEAADLQLAKLYYTGDPVAMQGGVGVCNDDDAGPIQGRAVVGGNADDGLTAYADGTNANSPDQLQGWARLDASTDGVTVRCGAEDGKRDATNPEPGDSMDDCG